MSSKIAFNKRFHNAATNYAQSEKLMSDMAIEAVLNYFEKQYQAQYIGNILFSIHNVDGFREEVRKKIVKFLNDFSGFQTKKDDNGNFVFVDGKADVKKDDKKLRKALERNGVYDLDEAELKEAIKAWYEANPEKATQPETSVRGIVVAKDRANKMHDAIKVYLETLSGGTIFGKKIKDEAKEEELILVPSQKVKLAKIAEKAGEKVNKEVTKHKMTREQAVDHYAAIISAGFQSVDDFVKAYQANQEAKKGAALGAVETTTQAVEEAPSEEASEAVTAE